MDRVRNGVEGVVGEVGVGMEGDGGGGVGKEGVLVCGRVME